MAQAALEREWREALALIKDRELCACNAELRALLLLIEGAPATPSRGRNMRRVIEIVAAFRTFHTEYPLPVVMPETLQQGTIEVALRQKADDKNFRMRDDELLRSGILEGPTGEGKSTVIYHLARAARAAGQAVLIITPKREPMFEALAARDENFLILTPPTQLNMIRPDPRLTLADDIAIKVDSGASALWAAEDYRQVMTAAYTSALRADPEATMHDVLRAIAAMDRKGETYKYRDALRGALLRHQRIIDRFPGWHTKGAPGLDVLSGRSVFLRLNQTTEAELFLVTYVLRRLFHHAEAADANRLHG